MATEGGTPVAADLSAAVAEPMPTELGDSAPTELAGIVSEKPECPCVVQRVVTKEVVESEVG